MMAKGPVAETDILEGSGLEHRMGSGSKTDRCVNEAKVKEGLEAKAASLETSGLSMSQNKDRLRGNAWP